MRLPTAFASLCLLAALAFAPSANAHHSPVMFDQSRTISLTGTVRLFQWTNPNCHIQLLVDEGGRQSEWAMEMGAPVYLHNRGWRPSTLRRRQGCAPPATSGFCGGSANSAR